MRTVIHIPTATSIVLDENTDIRKAYDNGETLSVVTDGIETYILSPLFANRLTVFHYNYKIIPTQKYEFVLEETL